MGELSTSSSPSCPQSSPTTWDSLKTVPTSQTITDTRDGSCSVPAFLFISSRFYSIQFKSSPVISQASLVVLKLTYQTTISTRHQVKLFAIPNMVNQGILYIIFVNVFIRNKIF